MHAYGCLVFECVVKSFGLKEEGLEIMLACTGSPQ